MNEDIVLTPMMKQFLDLKAKHPDAVMLLRCGDFYETYSTDAIVAAEILGITLTKRANGKGKTIEMAGFPHHALDTYLPKLIRAGKRVAICDQLEDPKLTKKLGIEFKEDMVEYNLKVIDKLAPESTASMQKDMAKGHQSEVQGLLFDMITAAEEQGIEIPTYRMVAEKFK